MTSATVNNWAWWKERLIDASCVILWIILTIAMVFYNKFLLSFYGFHYPISLTLWHMVVCSGLAAGCIHSKLIQPIDIPKELYQSKVLPIAACFAGGLWTSNAAYSISSVSFVQMIKAGMPVTVFLTGLFFGAEKFKMSLFLDILLITFGVGISAFGEAHLVIEGLILLVLSMFLDSVRLTLTQQMIQDSGVKFNPITTLYYVAPLASGFLSVPFFILEAKGAAAFLVKTGASSIIHFTLNALTAFGLNLSVYLLIGRTSALTMNVCGLVKDWFTISGSVFFFGSIVTVTNLVGYAIAFTGVGWYNYLRMPRTQQRQTESDALEEKVSLTGGGMVHLKRNEGESAEVEMPEQVHPSQSLGKLIMAASRTSGNGSVSRGSGGGSNH